MWLDPISIIHVLLKAVVPLSCFTNLQLKLYCKELLQNGTKNVAHNKLSSNSLVTNKISSKTHGIS